MVAVTIHVPLRDNDGAAFDAEDHEEFQTRLLAIFGGFTREPNPYQGGWKDENGAVYLDETFAFIVFVKGLFDSSSDILSAVAFAKTHYAQLAITIRYLGQAEIL